MAPQYADIQEHRAKTRVLLLRALHRAHGRQQEVARRRIARRRFVLYFKRLVIVILGITGLVGALRLTGNLPRVQVVIDTSASMSKKPDAMSAASNEKPVDETPKSTPRAGIDHQFELKFETGLGRPPE